MHKESQSADLGPVEGGGPSPETPVEEPLNTFRLSIRHRVSEFTCRSARVTDFLRTTAAEFEAQNYCRVFVLEDPNDSDQVWGYYTLTAGLIERAEISGSHQKKVPAGIPVPLVRIGYMGRDSRAPRGVGAALIVDAARRVFRNGDIAAWGLILDAEGAIQPLMAWYASVGFVRAKTKEGVMYAPFKSLIPELNPTLQRQKPPKA